MRWLIRPLDALHGHLFVWAPVCLGLGIALYFSLMQEPGTGGFAVAGLLCGGLAGLWRFGPPGIRPLAMGAALVAAGLLMAGARAHSVAAPVLGFRYYGPVEGRVLLIDRSSSDALRLTLDRVVLERMDPAQTPERVRITVGGAQPHIRLEPGQVVMLTAFLSPPEGAVEPGGFDFQRMAWFLRLGAVGFSRSPVMALATAEPGSGALFFARLRQSISDAVRAEFPGDAGGFVTAVLTNDTSGLGTQALEDLRASSLAHILSISGLHMSLLAAFVFGALRTVIALVPPLALRVSSKKIAAGVALAAAAFYYGLSGGAVATQRSFIMIAVMLVAVLVDRRAISLRTVAISALIVLIVQPESLLQAGFQMSFAATVGLVAAFAAVRDRPGLQLPVWLRPVGTVALASLVAGAATAPYGAAAFNRVSGYGLLANMAAEPVMALVVMPGAVLAGALAPLGLAWPVLWVMVQGARWILWASQAIAGLGGAVIGVVAPPPLALPLFTVGALLVVLVPFRARWLGLAAVVASLAIWGMADRPALLIARNGSLMGVLGPEGRALSRGRGEGFTARNWLENDGDLASQQVAGKRPGFSAGPFGPVARVGTHEVMLVKGADTAAAWLGLCQPGRVLILADPQADQRPEALACRIIDQTELARRGALAVRGGSGSLQMTGALEWAGRRLWSGDAADPGEAPDRRALPAVATAAAQTAGR